MIIFNAALLTLGKNLTWPYFVLHVGALICDFVSNCCRRVQWGEDAGNSKQKITGQT